MQLSHVHIRNYRGLREIELELDPLTVLVGENNCGKTTLLEALRCCLQSLKTRQSPVFEAYDFHLAGERAEPSSAEPITITLTFSEGKSGEWPDELIQALDGISQLDDEGRNIVRFQVQGIYGKGAGREDIEVDWKFLDLNGHPLTTQQARLSSLGQFQRCVPLFYLSALRDAGTHFHERGTFWRPFLRTDSMTPERKGEIEQAIERLNELILSSHSSFDQVRTELNKVDQVVATGAGDVSIDAIPLRIFDMLTRTEVSLSAPGGARIPLGRHGDGTQSLAVLLLFNAFLNARLKEAGEGFAEPILTLEEPEAHLHPSAVRSLFRTVRDLPGQKILATHSGDLLSEVDVLNVRRFARTADGIKIFKVSEDTLEEDELRKFNYHVRRFRGELLFSRCWLLAEGETDVTVLEEVARLLGHDLEAKGVRCVEVSHVGIKVLLKAAEALGISWHLLADDDQGGRKYRDSARLHLHGRNEQDRISMLPAKNIEVFLCQAGFGAIYRDNVPKQNRQRLEREGKWEPENWETIGQAIQRTQKIPLAIQVLREMESRLETVPRLFHDVISKAMLLAGR